MFEILDPRSCFTRLVSLPLKQHSPKTWTPVRRCLLHPEQAQKLQHEDEVCAVDGEGYLGEVAAEHEEPDGGRR